MPVPIAKAPWSRWAGATCHICASPRLDHTAARDIGFRCIWIDRGTGRRLLDDYRPDLILPTLDRVPEAFQDWGWMARD